MGIYLCCGKMLSLSGNRTRKEIQFQKMRHGDILVLREDAVAQWKPYQKGDPVPEDAAWGYTCAAGRCCRSVETVPERRSSSRRCGMGIYLCCGKMLSLSGNRTRKEIQFQKMRHGE